MPIKNKPMYTENQLIKERYWTKELCKAFLKDITPIEKINTHKKAIGKKYYYYSIKDIEKIEKTVKFKEAIKTIIKIKKSILSATEYEKKKKKIEVLLNEYDKKEADFETYLKDHQKEFISKIVKKENWLKKKYPEYLKIIYHEKIDFSEFKKLLDENFYLLKPYSAVEYEYQKKKNQKHILFCGEDKTGIVCPRISKVEGNPNSQDKLLFKNPYLSNKLQSWSGLYSITGNGTDKYQNELHDKHLSNSKKRGSKFSFDLDKVKQLEKLAFRKGIGYLSEANRIYIFLRFDVSIGTTEDSRNSDIICLQVERKKIKGKYLLHIHGYPTNELDVQQKLGQVSIPIEKMPK